MVEKTGVKACLITGIGGFIGSHCIAHLLVNTDWNIVGIDSWNHKGISERITDSVHYQNNKHRVKIYTHDLSAPISSILEQHLGKVEYIINFASQSHVDRSITDPVPFVQNNINIVLNMLQYARKIKPEKFIQIGTDESYGPTDGINVHKEWSTILPSNPYSASKAAQEAIAISYWRTYGVPVILTNTMNNFAEMQGSEKFVPMVIKKVIKGEAVTIHADSSRKVSGSRCWLHARNHADALMYILQNIAVTHYPKTDRPGRFNIVGEKQMSNLDIANMVADIIGKKLIYELVDSHGSRPGHDLHYGLCGNKLNSRGWKMPKNFKESLEKMVRWYQANPKWMEE
jgi:dTDP-glucose 4,6-dehydratase